MVTKTESSFQAKKKKITSIFLGVKTSADDQKKDAQFYLRKFCYFLNLQLFHWQIISFFGLDHEIGINLF